MANSPSITALIDKVNEYFGLVKLKLTEKAPVVAHALNTLKLGNNTLAESVATAAGYSAAHIARRDNPHGVTPEQAGSYSTDDFQTLLAQKVSSGVIPISRYGTLSFLPAGVSGGFDGATTVKATADNGPSLRESFPMQVEDNGTLTFLRNGTDGSSQGVYYGYVLNAVQGFVSSKVTVTTRRYKPPFIPADKTVAYVYTGGTGIIAGRVQDDAGVVGNSFLALMNGTMDALAHSEVWLDGAAWEDKLNRSEVVLAKDAVYIIYNQYAQGSPPVSVPLDFELYKIPLSAFGSGQTVTPTKLTVGQCTGFMGAQYSTGNIRLAAVAEATDTATPALVQHIGAPGSGYFSGTRMMAGSGRSMTQSALNSDGTKMRTLCYQDARWQASGGNLQVAKLAFSWMLDLNTLQVTLDAGLTPTTISLVAGPALSYGGTTQGPNNGIAIMTSTSGDLTPRTYLTESGLIFTSRIAYNPVAPESIYRGKWNTFTSIFDYLKAPMYDRIPDLRETLTVPVNFGSALGDGFDGFRLLPGNVGAVYCRNNSSTGDVVRTRLRAATDPLDYNYTYKSQAYPAGLPGFKPSTERVSTPSTADKTIMIGTLHEMDDTSLKRVNGSVLCNFGGLNTRPVDIASDLTTTGTVSATIVQLETLRDELIVAAGFDPTGKFGTASIELVIPQNPAIPCWAFICVMLANGDRRMVIGKVNVSSRTGAIATLTANGIYHTGTFAIAPNPTGVLYGIENGLRQGSHWIYETADAWLIAGNGIGYFAFAGGGSMASYRFLLNKSDLTAQNAVISTASANIVGTRWAGLPGQGLGGMYHYDFTTKLVFAKAARTRAEYIAWTLATVDNTKVILSQEVTQGWVVYFTEDTPVIVNGVVGTLLSTNIDLTTVKANPANTTFYVYVNMINEAPVYQIYDTFQTETTDLLFIGTVTTNATGISAIDVQKVTKFAGFRLSTTPAGSSIPVTTGLPSREAHLDSNWL